MGHLILGLIGILFGILLIAYAPKKMYGFFRMWMEEDPKMVKILPWAQRFIGACFVIWGIQDLVRYFSGD